MESQGEKETSRIEAFSDGVFAIAITLLCLELKLPHLGEGASSQKLAAALLKQWPSYMSYVCSFLTILIMWINHHRIFNMIRRMDSRLLLYNGFLLLVVAAVPFPTALLAQYFTSPAADVACAVYAGTYIMINIAFNLLWLHIAQEHRLLKHSVSKELARTIRNKILLGFPGYLAALLLAYVNVYLSVGICFLLWIFWVFLSKDVTQEAEKRS